MILELEHVYKDYMQGKMEVHILKDISLFPDQYCFWAILKWKLPNQKNKAFLCYCYNQSAAHCSRY